jgi:putative intracellular protease/amidase
MAVIGRQVIGQWAKLFSTKTVEKPVSLLSAGTLNGRPATAFWPLGKN